MTYTVDICSLYIPKCWWLSGVGMHVPLFPSWFLNKLGFNYKSPITITVSIIVIVATTG